MGNKSPAAANNSGSSPSQQGSRSAAGTSRSGSANASTTPTQDTPFLMAASPGAGVPAVAGADMLKVAWVSVDPRGGTVTLYPPPIASRVEEAYQQARRSVSLRGCGSSILDGATIEFGAFGDEADNHTQKMQNGGRRDVRRIEAAAGATEIVVHVGRERSWRLVNESIPGVTEERRVDISHLPACQRSGSAGANGLSPARGSSDPAAKELREKVVADGDARGLVGVWEWCRLPEPPDLLSLPNDAWGQYSEDQNSSIEAAFRAGHSSLELSIGIRQYQLIIDTPSTGRQVDRGLKKRRHVRRRLVSSSELRELMAAAADEAASARGNGNFSDEDCPICCSAFSETSTMPVVQLPGCGHRFHGACIQQVADKKGQCPLCRSDVDWKAVFGSMGRLR